MSVIVVKDLYNEMIKKYGNSKSDFRSFTDENEYILNIMISDEKQNQIPSKLLLNSFRCILIAESTDKMDFDTYVCIKRLFDGEQVMIGGLNIKPFVPNTEYVMVIMRNENKDVVKSIPVSKVPFSSQKDYDDFYDGHYMFIGTARHIETLKGYYKKSLSWFWDYPCEVQRNYKWVLIVKEM